jgi:hypothetical protein
VADEDAAAGAEDVAAGAEEDAEDDAAGEEDEGVVVGVELVELDEQPATARADRATAPETQAIRRSGVRRGVLFMAPSLDSRGIAYVSSS